MVAASENLLFGVRRSLHGFAILIVRGLALEQSFCRNVSALVHAYLWALTESK